MAVADGPECETCGKTACPDADLPGFSEPGSCAYLPIYNALRYDRCEYGCGRDITKAAIERDIVPTVDRLVAAARAEALRDAVDEMRRMMDGFPQRGRHTRAGWALAWLERIAEEADRG